ncbi:type II toxin-antitoxin system RelE/ParE family toxin [Duganella sp. PWIR1]
MIQARFLPEAEDELMKEVAYYSNAGSGLGAKFQLAVEEAVKLAAAKPEAGTPAQNGTRRRIIKGFPFSVVYRPSDTEILIVALAHHRRKPGYWLGRKASK